MYRRGLLVALCLLAFACDDAQGVPDQLSEACLREAECAGETLTAQGERECRESWLAQYDEASMYGCATPHADWITCLAAMECPPPTPEPCESQQLAFERCQGRAGRDSCSSPASAACR
jgi:hypothetical protein